MLIEENKAVLQRAVECWNEGNLDAYLQFYHSECMFHGVGSGVEQIRKFYEGILIAFPGNQLALNQVIAEGDKVACNFVLTATHQGPLMGIPPTGKQVTMTGTTIIRLADGRFVERWSQLDFLGLLQQLGVAPSPGQQL